MVLEGILESSQLNIIKARSGNEALGLLLEYDVALVLMDVQMPGMDGFETAEIMRSSAYKLPLQRTKTAVASYHFFRLLQRTRHAVIIFNSVPDVMGGGEVSRFVLQIENELTKRNPQIRVIRKVVNVPMAGPGNRQETTIRKEPDVIRQLKKMAEKGISPSALNAYVRCPLQFYYRTAIV